MDIHNIRATSNALDEGEWIGEIAHLDGVRLKVRGVTSPQVSWALGIAARRAGKHVREESGVLTEIGEREVEDIAYRRHALLDWEGFTDDGKPVPFSPEAAENLFSIPLLANGLRVAVMRATVMASERLEVLRGNSPAPSGKRSGAARK